MATKVNKSKLKTNINNIDNSLNNLSKEIKNLNSHLDAMMKGNADGPYWNGASAKVFYTRAISNLKNDIDDYKMAHNKLKLIAEKYDKLVTNDK